MNNPNDKQDSIFIDLDAIRDGTVQLAKTNAITTNAAWTTFINGRTDAQMLTFLRGFFRTLVKFDP